MAWVTVIGPAVEQVEYRLQESAGCGLAHAQEHAHEHAAGDAQVDYRMAEERLTWFGGGLAGVGIEAGTALSGEEDKARARALMDGVHPDTGEQLVTPKRAAHPASKLPAGPLLAALEKAAAERGVELGELPRTRWGRARIARLARMVERDGDTHRIPVKDAERLAASLPEEAGLDLAEVYAPGELQVARAHRDETVRIGDRGFDLTFDLPKSYSVVWALAGDELAERMRDAFREAVMETLADVEAWCAYGMRGEHGGGKTARRVDTSGLLGWVMWHDEARPVDGQDPDPHVHAHAVIAHMVRGVDGQWSTPGNGGREFHRHIEAAGALVRARLRAKTTAMGFRWERQPGGRVWELAGVPAELRVVFSKRQGQIHRLLQRLGFEDPRTASTAHAKVAAARSREGKDTAGTSSAQASPSTTVHGGDLRGSWRRQADDAGHEPGMVVAAARPGGPDDGPTIGGPGDGPTPPPPPTPGVREVAERIFAPDTGLTAHNKVATQPRVLAAVLDELPGVADVADAERLAAAVVALPDGPAVPLPAAGGRERGPAFQTHPERYTSADIVEAERTALALTEHGLRHGADEGLAVVDGEVTAMAIGAFEAAKGFALSTQQRAVVERLTGAGHGVDAVIGVAGAGKTTLMAAARSAWNVAGFTVRGATTAAAAAQQLAAESGIPAQTIASLLRDIDDPDRPGLAGTDVLVIDEAAMVDDRELARLLQAAADAGTKVVLIGDPLQLRAIGVGGCFAAIHQAVDGLTLTENRRQRDRIERAALAKWRDDDRTGALRTWADAGHVHAGDDRDDTLATLLADWVATRVNSTFADVHEELNGLLVLAGTNADVTALNAGARAIRRQTGEITGPDRHYRLAGGGVLALAEGDHVRVRRNDYRTRHKDAPADAVDVLNGYRGIITGFGGRGGRDPIVEWRRDTADGPVIETATITAARVAAGDLSHGTAMTVAAAQGQTGDRTLVYGMGLDPHALYPAMSRDREQVHLYLPRALLETDADRAAHGDPHGPADELTRAITAYARTLQGDRADKLVSTELDTEFDTAPAPTTSNGEAAAGPARPAVPHWRQRPYGAHTDAELARLAAAYEREVTYHQRHTQALAAEKEAARRGEGPAAVRLAERRTALQEAADADTRLDRLDRVIDRTRADERAATDRILRLQQQLTRNPVTLRLSGTSRARLREDLTAAEADRTQALARRQAAEQQRRDLTATASAPYQPPGAGGIARPRWTPGAAGAELADLTSRWDEHLAEAVREDLATAHSRAQDAVHGRARVAAMASETYTHTLDQALDQLTTVNTELTRRQLLPPDQAAHEHAERGHYRQARRTAQPHHPGPGHDHQHERHPPPPGLDHDRGRGFSR